MYPKSELVFTTETPVRNPVPIDTRPYVVCRLCRYEKPMGTACGEPCV